MKVSVIPKENTPLWPPPSMIKAVFLSSMSSINKESCLKKQTSSILIVK